MATLLAKLCAKLLLKVIDELLHDSIDSLVVQRLSLVLQDEVHSIRLLAFWQILALIDIEELDCLEQFLLCLISNTFHFSERHVAVKQQRQVAAYGRELAYLCVGDVLVLDDAHDLVPADVCEINGRINAECLCELTAGNLLISL